MAINEAEFKNAFRKVVSSEFSDIPTDEDSIEFTFSKRFHKRMDKLIRSQRKIYYRFVNTALKRVAVICVTVITLFAATFSVEAIREPIIRFVKQVFENHFSYTVDGFTTDSITKEYSLTWLPEGFQQSNKIQNDTMITTEYTDDSNNIIEFTQWATKNFGGFSIDNEHSKTTTEIINDVEVTFRISDNTKSAFWVKEGYTFEINSYGDIDIDTIKAMIKSIE